MLNKSKAIVLHQVKFGETSIITTLYTEKYGRLSCIANGVRSKKAKIPINLFLPLSLLQIDFYYRQTREIHRLKDAVCLVHYHSLPYNPVKSTVAIFLSEVLFLTLQEHESNPELFSFLFHSFQLFDHLDQGSTIFHHWFLIHLTKYLGIFPYEEFIAYEDRPVSGIEIFRNLNESGKTALYSLLKSPQGPPVLSNFEAIDKNDLLERILHFYSVHIEGFKRLKSYSVLREVFKSSPS